MDFTEFVDIFSGNVCCIFNALTFLNILFLNHDVLVTHDAIPRSRLTATFNLPPRFRDNGSYKVQLVTLAPVTQLI